MWVVVLVGLLLLGSRVWAEQSITVIMPRHEMDVKGVWESRPASSRRKLVSR